MLSRRMLARLAGPILALPALPAAAQSRAGTLRVVSPWEIGGLDPARSGYIFVRMQVAETLVTTDRDNNLAPLLARGWRVDEDGLTWTFDLRAGATFHDGTALSAEAVAASLRRAQTPPGILAAAPVAAIEAAGDAVRIRTSRPFAALPAFLAHSSTLILAPGASGPDGAVRTVIGTGPFRLTALTPPQGFEAERFDGWWGGKVAASGARYLAVTRGETRTLMADTGEADLVFNLPPTAFQRLSRSGHVALTTAAIPRSYILKLNAGGFFFGDVRARRALSMAIDRAGIAAGLLRTPDAAATQLFPPSLSGWHDPSLPPLAHDPQAARRLLAEAGWQPGADGVLARDGRAFRVTLRTFPDRPEQPVLATAIQAQLKEVGIVAEVAIGNSGDIPLGHRDGTLDLGLAARNFSLVPDPIGTLLQDYGPEGGDWGAMGWSGAGSAELAELIGTLSGTFDPAAAATLRHRAAAILQAELPVVPLAWFVHSVAAGKRLAGVTLDPFEQSYRLSDIRLGA